MIPLTKKTGTNINKNWGSAAICQIKENHDYSPVSVYFPGNYEYLLSMHNAVHKNCIECK